MAARRLTDASLERLAAPRIGRTEVSDIEKGLFVYVRPTGSKGWVAVYRVAGGTGPRAPRQKLHLGDWPRVSIAEARSRAREISAMAVSGLDPKLEEKRQARTKADNSVRAVAQAWLSAMLAGQATGRLKRAASPSTYRNREAALRLHIIPRMGSLPMEDVTPALLGNVLQSLDDEGGPVDETLKAINGLWSFAESRGLSTGPRPSAHFKPRQVAQSKPRALDDDELHSIWHAAETMGYPFGTALQLLMLTGQRRSEIMEAEWDWVGPDYASLTVPLALTKNRAGNHEVMLGATSRAILERTSAVHSALHPQSPFIFTSRTGETPASGWSQALKSLELIRKAAIAGLTEAQNDALWARGIRSASNRRAKAEARSLVEAVDLPSWRIHDLRHTFITRARDGDQNAQGEVVWSAAIDVVQATVNHSIHQGVTGIYDHGDIARRYRIRRRELAEWWGSKLAEIVA